MQVIILILLLLTVEMIGQITVSGTEQIQHATTSNAQQQVATAMDIAGNYIVVWESQGQDGSGFGIYAQLYDATGAVLVAEWRVNTTTSNDQRYPAVAMRDNGSFMIVWQSYAQDGDGWGIYGKVYSSTAVAQTTDFLVNTTTTGQQRFPQISVDGQGNYGVVWDQDWDIYVAQYNRNGVVQKAPFLVNTTTSSSQGFPDIGIDDKGRTIIVWQSLGQDGSGYGIFGQRLSVTWSLEGSEFQVNSTSTNMQINPAVAMDSVGNFIVVWTSYAQDGDAGGIYGQFFKGDATRVGAEVVVNTTTAGDQDNAAIGINSEGEILIAWNSYAQDTDKAGIYQQAFYYDGTQWTRAYQGTQSVETLVNTTVTDFQQFPAVAMRSANHALVLWQNKSTGDYDVLAQQFSTQAAFTLPLEALYFQAERTNEYWVNVDWQTEGEQQNKGFHLQRMLSTEQVFESIAWLEGQNQAVSSYHYRDNNAHKGDTYYRLMQVDMDGAKHYSEVRQVGGIVKEQTFRLFPNPFIEVLYIHASLDQLSEFHWQLYSLDGRLVYEGFHQGGEQSIFELRGLSGLAEGTYQLHLYFEGGEQKIFAVVKTR